MTSARPFSALLPAHVVRRSRLVDSINRVGARLIVVTGPAGSGKTVAVREWASTVELPVGWLQLDARHTDPEQFLESLLDTLEGLSPGVHEATWRDDPGDHAADHAVARAVEHLAAAPQATLVLDDLHVIDRSPTAGMLSRLVEVIPATNLSLIALSRSDPPFPLHRFRLAGQLVELRESDLRFDRDEAARFFARFPQVDLDDRHVDRLAERTEGWAAGLQFAALSLAGRPDPDAFVERFAGSDRHVADFLLDEVLDRQPAEVREFLLATSVLDRLCVELCEHVTGRADAAVLLRRVEAEHLFLVPLDDERDWFRYHHLFGQLLRREVRVSLPEVERTSHARAAEWYLEQGQPAHAIGHLLDAGEYERAFDLLGQQLHDHLQSGRHETLRGWLARFPDAFIDATPGRQLLAALAHARIGELERGRLLLDRARAAPTPSAAAVPDAVALTFDITESAIAAVVGDPDKAISLGVEAWNRRAEVDLATLPPDIAAVAREMWGYLPTALARTYALLDDRASVRHWAAVLRRQGPRLRSDLVGALGAEAWAEARWGRLRAAAELADQALVLGTEYGRGARRAMIGARATLALVHRERNELDQAIEVLHPHLDPALREGHVAIATLGEVELAAVECSRGEGADAIARLLRVRRDRAARGTPAFLATVMDQAECRIRARLGDVDRAIDLLDEIAPGPERTLLDARIALVTGRSDDVGSLLADLRAASDDRRRWFEAVALSARAAADAGDLSLARRLLAEVAPVVEREGAVRPFLDEGFDIVDLLGLGSPSGTPAPGRAAARSPGTLDLVEPLSERELSVLRYLPSRLSNREIGAELFVSLNTVKSHLKTIYRKLDVERREEAVRRARQLGLI
ncbi:MAG TPA: LuxR C-terminal-related transcriptional regulator [Acidimicrobiales bacterium]|nr:LuxR C-terminal-related transcriptional regulator [Acidimicrobiales bacterium]